MGCRVHVPWLVARTLVRDLLPAALEAELSAAKGEGGAEGAHREAGMGRAVRVGGRAGRPRGMPLADCTPRIQLGVAFRKACQPFCRQPASCPRFALAARPAWPPFLTCCLANCHPLQLRTTPARCCWRRTRSGSGGARWGLGGAGGCLAPAASCVPPGPPAVLPSPVAPVGLQLEAERREAERKAKAKKAKKAAGAAGGVGGGGKGAGRADWRDELADVAAGEADGAERSEDEDEVGLGGARRGPGGGKAAAGPCSVLARAPSPGARLRATARSVKEALANDLPFARAGS